MTSPSPLLYDTYYHIYNRGTNRENIFMQERNYEHFMLLYARHIDPVAETFAYCLLRNHFHLLVRIRLEEEIRRDMKTLKVSSAVQQLVKSGVGANQSHDKLRKPLGSYASRKFSDFFNAYAKGINAAYGRTGSLFQHPFGRVDGYQRPPIPECHCICTSKSAKARVCKGFPRLGSIHPTVSSSREIQPTCKVLTFWIGLAAKNNTWSFIRNGPPMNKASGSRMMTPVEGTAAGSCAVKRWLQLSRVLYMIYAGAKHETPFVHWLVAGACTGGLRGEPELRFPHPRPWPR